MRHSKSGTSKQNCSHRELLAVDCHTSEVQHVYINPNTFSTKHSSLKNPLKPHQKILNSSDPPNLCTWQCAALWNTTSQGIGFTMLGASAVSQSDRWPTFFSTPKKQPAFSKCNTKPGRPFFMSVFLLNPLFPTLRRWITVKYLESRTRSKTEHRMPEWTRLHSFLSP